MPPLRNLLLWSVLLTVAGLWTPLAVADPAVGLEPVDYSPAPVLKATLQKTEELPINLALVLERLGQENLAIKQQALRAKLAGTETALAVGELLPDISLSYQQSRFEGAIQVFGGQVFDVTRNTIQPQISASWRLNPAGRDLWLARAEYFEKKAEDRQLTDTTRAQTAKAMTTYFDFLAAHLQLAVAQQALATAEEAMRTAELKELAGVSPKLDVMRAKTELLQRQSSVLSAETAIAQREQDLLEVLNWRQGLSLVPDLNDAKVLVLLAETPETQALLASAQENNAGLQALRQQEKALGETVKAAFAAVVPDVTLNAYVNRTGPEWDQLQTGRFAGLAVEFNALDGLGTRTFFTIRQGIQQKEALTLERQALEKSIETRLIKALLEYKQAQQQLKLAQQQLEASREANRLALARFNAGVATQLDALDTEASYREAQATAIQAVLGVNTAQIQVMEAAGKL